MFAFLDAYKTKIRSSWAVHTTDRHIRVLEIEGTAKRWKVKRLAKINLDKGIIENGIVKNEIGFKNALSKIKTETFPSAPRSPYIITNINEDYVFFRTIKIPKMTEKEVEEAIRWEAESNIPLPIDKVYLSWKILKENDKLEEKTTVLLAATLKSIVEQKIKLYQEAGFTPIVIEAESAALCRSLAEKEEFEEKAEPLIILNLKEHYTHIIIYDSGIIHLSSILDTAGEDFNEVISRAFKIKLEDAEKLRQKIGWLPSNEIGRKIIEITEPIFVPLKKEIGSAVSFYKNKTGKDVRKILLTAERTTKWQNFSSFLKKETGLETKWQNRWDSNIWPSKCPYVSEENEEYNVSIGLALRRFEENF